MCSRLTALGILTKSPYTITKRCRKYYFLGWLPDVHKPCLKQSDSFLYPQKAFFVTWMSAGITPYTRKEPTNIDNGFTQDPPVSKLPVPPLSQTLQRYLAALEAVVTPADLRRAQEDVGAFGAAGGVGEKVQAKLEEFAQHSQNWVYDWWLDDMYMKNRVPLPINSNPGMPFPPQDFQNEDDQFKFAANMMLGILDYHEEVHSGSLPVDRAPGRDKFPMCMSQYHRLLTSYRRPCLPKDRLISTEAQQASGDWTVIVACRGQFFVLKVSKNSKRISKSALIHQLKQISKMSMELPHAPQVGLFTSEHRDTWAKIRETMAKDPLNRSSLEAIEHCLCVVCLDEPLPVSFNLRGSDPSGEKKRDDVNRAHQMLHGGGSKFNTHNRWFDKTFQLIVGSDGICGLCYEHSPAEGIIVIQLLEKLLQAPEDSNEENEQLSLNDLPPPQKLQWNVNQPELQTALRAAAANIDKLINDLDFYVLRFNDYGREFPKMNKTSPDAYIQLALQLTYYKVHRKLGHTYESAGTRRFRFGRVDNIRSASMGALNWVKAMGSDATNEEKLRLFKKAAGAQAEIMVNNITGQGIDCHLLALRELSKELNLPTPAIFLNECYKNSNHFVLSTSQVPTQTDSFMGYGPVVPNGYGASYNPHKDSIVFCIASFYSDNDTNSEFFAQSLESSLLQMRELLTAPTGGATNS